MEFKELQKEEMYAFVAPDGSIQVATLALEYAMCFAICKLLAKAGYGKTPQQMLKEGFHVVPVKVTITQNGVPSLAYEKALANSK